MGVFSLPFCFKQEIARLVTGAFTVLTECIQTGSINRKSRSTTVAMMIVSWDMEVYALLATTVLVVWPVSTPFPVKMVHMRMLKAWMPVLFVLKVSFIHLSLQNCEIYFGIK